MPATVILTEAEYLALVKERDDLRLTCALYQTTGDSLAESCEELIRQRDNLRNKVTMLEAKVAAWEYAYDEVKRQRDHANEVAHDSVICAMSAVAVMEGLENGN